jgi:hypothetical protein
MMLAVLFIVSAHAYTSESYLFSLISYVSSNKLFIPAQSFGSTGTGVFYKDQGV